MTDNEKLQLLFDHTQIREEIHRYPVSIDVRDFMVFMRNEARVAHCASSVRNDTMEATLHRWKKERLEISGK
jgi:hypothetical protein